MANYTALSLLRCLIRKRNKKHCYLLCRKISTLQNRGIIQTIIPEQRVSQLEQKMSKGQQTAYCGYDPTADSLHIGNLLSIIALLHWQTLGHRSIVVIGEYTAEIGDPSDRSQERIQLNCKKIETNSLAIEENVQKIFNNFKIHLSNQFITYTDKFTIFKNSQWYQEKPGALLVEISRHFRVSTMLSRESVKARLKGSTEMKLSEFLYQVFQAYDWLHLFKEDGCLVQFGGNDQLGNILAGHELINRVYDQTAYGFTVPLITTRSGEKLGKSLDNAIWLNPRRTSPKQFYNHFMNVSDEDVHRYLKLFTFIPLSTIDEIMAEHKMRPHLKVAQEALASHLSLLVHGDDAKSVYLSEKEKNKQFVM